MTNRCHTFEISTNLCRCMNFVFPVMFRRVSGEEYECEWCYGCFVKIAHVVVMINFSLMVGRLALIRWLSVTLGVACLVGFVADSRDLFRTR